MRVLLLLLLWTPVYVQAASILDPGQGVFVLDPGETGASELSGITHVSGDQFYVVSDKGARLFPLTISIDPRTGFILAARLGEGRKLPKGVDFEGVAYHPERKSLLVSDERGPAIREYGLDGAHLAAVELPRIYAQSRLNQSLESLSMDPEGKALWTVNESALSVDGGRANLERGAVVRIQKLSSSYVPSGQWAYLTDPIPGSSMARAFRLGVTDLAALPGGEILVLERAVSDLGLSARIFAVDFKGAADTSSIPSLEKQTVAPVTKRLLWEHFGLSTNFEGMALGPKLEEGDHSLILISDDAGLFAPTLYALRLRGLR